MVKNPPAKWEMRVQFLGQEDPLEKEMATHSRILAREIPWAEEPGGLQSMGCEESDMTEQLHRNKTISPPKRVSGSHQGYSGSANVSLGGCGAR